MKTVSHHGRETTFRETTGTGPTTLFVHGSGGSHRVWANQYGPDGCHPAVALDLSGHGESDDIGSETDPREAYTQDVVAVATATDADVLVGNSMGGAIVLDTLLSDRYQPAGVVLAGTGAKLTVHESLLTALESDFEGAVQSLHEADRLFHDVDPEIVERSQAQLRATGQAVTERDFRLCHDFDVRDRLPEVETPVLALVGEHDSLTPVSYHEAIAKQVQNGRLTVLDDAAHLAMIEQPTAFNAALSEFREQSSY